VPKRALRRDDTWRGDASSEEQGGAGRGAVYAALRRGDITGAIATARAIRHPWYRCQSLAMAAMDLSDTKLRLVLVDEAFAAADVLDEPNRVVTVASWPIEVLAAHGPVLRLRREVDRLVGVASTEPHSLRRADALAMLLVRAWQDQIARQRVLAAFLATCHSAHGWRRDRLLLHLVPELARDEPKRVAEVVAMIEDPRTQRRAQRDLEAVSSESQTT
jgi:hypothetical protein